MHNLLLSFNKGIQTDDGDPDSSMSTGLADSILSKSSPSTKDILVINAGTGITKFQLYDKSSDGLVQLMKEHKPNREKEGKIQLSNGQ